MANIDEESQITKSFQDITDSGIDVNILLLGETGVGKSTLINAFTNYLEYENFDIAEKGEVRCLIPTKFVVMNEDFEEKVIEIGKDDNENNTMTESGTRQARSYVFPINRKGIHTIRLIDTPGIGDPRGIDRDDENMENILSYISHIENLHAICFLLKPNNTRLTVIFHYCIKRLLSRLENSASKNIIFLFTNTRSTFYQPGDTITPLRAILKDIKNKPPFADIKFGKDNVFCLDNESFRYLVAVKNGVELGDRQNFVESWKQSAEECWRMLHYVSGQANSNLTPHKVKDTVCVNEARRIILQLSQPLADIADLINDNIKTLEWQNQTMQRDSLSTFGLKNLYVPVINLRCKELSQPITVCTAESCIEIYTINNIKKYHYKQICHDPCFLRNVPREYIGSPELIHCKAMSNHKCKICNCDYRSHMHIYYMTETYEDQIDNEGVKAQIKDREAAINIMKTLIANMESRKAHYENEMDTIIKTIAKFAYFLQRNLISPYNDAYKGYIEYRLDSCRERSQSKYPDFEMIKYYNDLLQRYTKEKQILDGLTVMPADVFDSVQALYKLPYTGTQIENLHSWIIRNQSNEHKNTEFLETSRQQVIQKKQNTKNKNNNYKQNQRQAVKNKIIPNNQPNIKAKKRKSDSKEQNVNHQNLEEHPTRQQGIYDLICKDVPNYVTDQDLPLQPYRTHNPTVVAQRHSSSQQEIYEAQCPIFQQRPPQNNNMHQLMYSKYLPNSRNFQDFSPQHGNFLNRGITLPPPIPHINDVNIKSNTNSLNTNDSNFDECYKNNGSSNDPPKNSNTSGHLMHYSNLLKIEESSDDEFHSDQDDSSPRGVTMQGIVPSLQQGQSQNNNSHYPSNLQQIEFNPHLTDLLKGTSKDSSKNNISNHSRRQNNSVERNDTRDNLLKKEESSDDEFYNDQYHSSSSVVTVDTSCSNFQQDPPQSNNSHFGRKQINSNSLSMVPDHERDLNESMDRHNPKHSVKPRYSKAGDDVSKNNNKQKDSEQKKKSCQNNSDLVKLDRSNNFKRGINKFCNIL
ncbi:50S ribosome-binding GTPase [Oryctes borbonicus]|uniref:50S ribosome-binding GTPase n=1 Tax=Oryctes borbonicus TaxID=1629725 RepID=A0A0T6B1B3_9SCAR|nr:50S ribosome-binding GTPase [Oryctes borbonicus]